MGRGEAPSADGRNPPRNAQMRITVRTAQVLAAVAELPGGSNRAVSERAGIPDQGQMSKLLKRLERHGLIENSGPGHTARRRNAWSLTAAGRRIAQGISVHAGRESGGGAGR